MKNIIFDVDGTLWDTTEVVIRAWNKAISEVGGTSARVTFDIIRKEFGKPVDKIAEDLFYDVNEEQRCFLMDKCFEYEHEALKENMDNLLFPGVKETIEKLSEKCSLFIVSNCESGYIELFMEKSGVEKYIKDYECFGDTLMSKGENIKLVIERNNLDDVVYVGDTQGDYEAATFAGIPFVFAKYGFGSVENYDFAINSIKEMLDLCKR